MFKNRVILLALALLLSFAMASTVYAYWGKGGPMKKGMESEFYCKAYLILDNRDELGLSDKDIEKVKDLKLSTKKALIMKDAQIEVAALDIKSAIYKNKVDMDEVNRLTDQKYELKKDKTKTLIAAYVKLEGMLSDEQKAKLKDLCADMNKSGMKGCMTKKMN